MFYFPKLKLNDFYLHTLKKRRIKATSEYYLVLCPKLNSPMTPIWVVIHCFGIPFFILLKLDFRFFSLHLSFFVILKSGNHFIAFRYFKKKTWIFHEPASLWLLWDSCEEQTLNCVCNIICFTAPMQHLLWSYSDPLPLLYLQCVEQFNYLWITVIEQDCCCSAAFISHVVNISLIHFISYSSHFIQSTWETSYHRL